MYFCTGVQAQNVYLMGSDDNIYRLNLDSSLTNIISVNLPPQADVFDIALSPSNVFYGISQDNIIQIDNSGNTTILATLPEKGHYNGLTCSNDYELYTIHNLDYDLYKYNILTNTTELVAHLGFGTPGDLTFYKGNIIFLAFGTNKIKAYNLENGSLVDIYCVPEQYANIWGIAGLYDSCDSTIIRFCTPSDVLELNFSNNTITDLNVDNLGFLGMTSDNEYLSSECSFQFETNSCELSLPNHLTNSESFIFPNPFIETIHLKNYEEVNSIEVFDINGRLILKTINPSYEINLSYLEKGMYLIKIHTDKEINTNKIVKI